MTEVQGFSSREDWLKWRQDRICSSDAPAIMKVSKWKTPMGLYEEKLAPFIVERSSFITDKGNEFEPRVRSLVEVLRGETFAPVVLDMYPLGASLDGRSSDGKRILEIKLVGKEDFECVALGRVPEHYKPQVQHQLYVSKAVVCIFAAYLYERGVKAVSRDKLALIEVSPDPVYQEQLINAEAQFMECIRLRRPPEATKSDFKTITTAGFAATVARWKEVKAKIDELEAQRAALENDMKREAEAAGHARLRCSDVRFVKVERVGAIDYSKVPELRGVDLEKYRKKPSTYWKIDIAKGEEQ